MKRNHVKRKLARGEVCFGTMIRMMTTPDAVPLSAAAGWDYVILDTEHCQYNRETAAQMALVARYEPLTFLVRIPDKHYHQIAGTLDLGAEGLVIPRVESTEEVERIIESAKYHPIGSRGASISTAATLFRPCTAREYLEWANAESLIVIQIESETAVEHIDELLEQRGIDAAMIGPFDLSQSLGIPGDLTHARVADAFQRVIDACRRHGVAPGVHLNDLDQVSQWVNAGMRFVTFQYDSKLLFEASRKTVEKLRSLDPGQA